MVLLLLVGCASEEAAPPTPPSERPTGQGEQRPTGPGEQRRAAAGLLKATPEQQERIRALCAATPSAPSNAPWTGLMNDAHVHTAIENDQPAFAIALLDEMNRSGIQRALLQPDHAPGMLEHQGFMAAVRAMEVAWADLAALCPRLVPLVYAFDPSDADSLAYVTERLDTGWYGGVGEIELQHVRLPIAHDPHGATLEAIYDLLDQRQLLFHFQASGRLDPELPSQAIAIARAHPSARFLWFACPQDETGWPPNLGCGELLHADTPGVREAERTIWGSDAAPAGFKNSSRGVLPYDDVVGAAAQVRQKFAAQDNDHSGVAASRFDALVPALPVTP